MSCEVSLLFIGDRWRKEVNAAGVGGGGEALEGVVGEAAGVGEFDLVSGHAAPSP